MPTIFSKIIAGEIPAYKVAEDEKHLAFLDVKPVCKGHVLVIPKQEIDYYFHMEDQAYSELNLFAKKVATGLKKAIECKKIGMAVVGLEVPHVHIHLMPVNRVSDMTFSADRLNLSEEEFKRIASKIAAKVAES